MVPDRWLAFVGVVLVVLCVPGPDFLVIFRHALGGYRRGCQAAAGVMAGLCLHTFIAAAGLATLIATHPAAFNTIRLAGAGYLTWLAATSLRSVLARRTSHRVNTGDEPGDDGSPAHPFRDGFLTDALNPKAVLFFVGLLPQFLNPQGSVVVQTLLLAGTTIVLAVLWWITLIYAIQKGLRILTRPRVRRAIDGVSAVMFLGLAGSILG